MVSSQSQLSMQCMSDASGCGAAPPAILVADDQPDVRTALRLLLKGAGHRVAEASSPAEVLAELRQRPFDAVLLDLNYTRDTTSGTEGLDLLNELRNAGTTAPVIVMTAWGTVEIAVEAMRRGACDFVLKPWDNDALLGTLQRHLAPKVKAPAPNPFEEDLAVARQVQSNLLPRNLKPVPTIDYGGACVEARGVGGDYYDFLAAPEGEFAAVLADVSGKGISAALLMANLQATIRSQVCQSNGSLCGMLETVNRLFLESTEPHNFATLFYSHYDPGSRRLRYVSCGHNPALLVRASGSLERLEASATVLGVFRDWTAREESTTLNPGDLLVVYSDGITEAGRGRDTEFGEERLAELLRRNRDRTVPSLVLSIVEAARNWGGPVPEDDLTVVVLRGGADPLERR